ncbi:MAG: response regulator [Sporomusaceae bacterium]|nr:response regulator [Sporomusaceae bacterium]
MSASIKAKILIPVIAMTLVLAGAVLISNILLFSNFVNETTVNRVNSTSKVAVNNINFLKAEAKAASLSMAKDQVIINSILNNRRDELLVRARALQNETGTEFCAVTDAQGQVIVRTHAPDSYGDSILAQTNIQSAVHGEALTAVEQGTKIRLAARSGTPIFDNGGKIIGVVSVGYRLDTEKFVESIKEMLGCEITVVLGEERIATTVMQKDGSRAIGTKADAHIMATVYAGNSFAGEVNILGRESYAKYVPIYGPDGQALAMLFVGRYADEAAHTISSFVQGGLIITFLTLAIAIAVILWIVGRIVTPIHVMTTAAAALAAGGTDLDIQVNTKDETYTLAKAFNSMIENTRNQVQIIERIAGGDLTVAPQTRSENDLMNLALQKLCATMRAHADEVKAEHERIKLMLDATPLSCRLWDRNYNLIECNEAAIKLFNLKNKQEYIKRYFELSPEYQPDGSKTSEKARAIIYEAFIKGACTHEWMYQMLDGTLVPSELTLVRVPYGNDFAVATYSRDLREHEKMLAEIKQRDHLLQTVNQAADILFRSEPDDFAQTLNQCMGMMAQAINADRMCIFRNHTENGELYCTQLYEWSGNVRPFFNSAMTANVSYDERTPEFKKTYLRGECVNQLVRDTPPVERATLSARGILAVLTVPIFIRDKFWGFVGFDNCRNERVFTENEESVMRSGALLVANALLRNEYLLKMRDTYAQLETALEEAKKANNAKGNFLASMSHEMRTPLNAIIGLSEIALDNPDLDADTKSYLEKIYNSGSTLLSIVNDILDISKIQSGKFVILPNQYDIPSLVNDSTMQNVLHIGSKPIRFILTIDEKMPALLYGDELRIKQIINNLLSNAFKYTETGAVVLSLLAEREGDTVWLIIRVSDTGIGIDPENLEHLFTDYEQFGLTAKHQAGGTGLGLAITKGLAEMMGGSIAVESKLREGTTFTVKIRQQYVSDTVIGPEVAKSLKRFQYSANKLKRDAQTAKVSLSYAHILLVDDNITNLDVAKGLMKPYGMQIDCVTNGWDAVSAVREEKIKYNAIFMDHMMPGIDGIETVRRIREDIGTDYARNVPIIALTANAVAGNEEMFLSKGFQAFISKPIDIMRLDSVLRHWVRDKTLEKELAAKEPIVPAVQTGSLFTGIEIEGINQKKALERFSNDERVFIDVLRSYASSTRSLLNNLREYLEERNLADYAIAIHGIKSASYSIFAQEAGKAAERLEIAAKAEAFEVVKTGHAAFETIAKELLVEIDQALAEIAAVIASRREAASLKTGSAQAEAHIPDNSLDFTAPEAKILLVDDNETNLKVAAGLLRPLKLRLDTAENGKEALAKIQEKEYHLIFMDHMMPVMDGIEAAAKLRQMEGAYYQKVPLIAFTANDAAAAREIFLGAGMNDFVTKPIDRKEIYAKIRQWLPSGLVQEQTLPADTATAAAVQEDEAGLPVIEGIDPQAGVLYSGSKELFLNLLGDFYKTIDLKAAKIEKCLADALVRDVTIETHALKSTARMIGAAELSAGFARLERYGNEENLAALKREVPLVLEKYRAYKPLLKPFGQASAAEKKESSAPELIAILKTLAEAMDNFDLDGADAALKELEKLKLPLSCQDHMETLSAYVADVAMEDVVKLTEVMVGLLEKLPEMA